MKIEAGRGRPCPPQDRMKMEFSNDVLPSSSLELLRTGMSALRANFRAAVLEGLRATPKTLPCRFLYDENGSRLFDEICDLEEYYLTRTESRLLETHIDEIIALCGPECLLVELGSGSSRKTRLLLDHLAAPVGYVPIDIAREQLERTSAELSSEYPDLEVLPICGDYNERWKLPGLAQRPQRVVTFYPG